MKRLLMSTAIIGLAALPGFAIAQDDEADDTMTQEQSETDNQDETGSDTEAETGSDTDMENDSSMEESTEGESEDSSETGSDENGSGKGPEVAEGHSEVEADTVEADELEGAPVMSQDGEDIAKVSEVLMTEDGSIEAIVVNVGGFLGIGSKPVEIPFDEVTLQTNDEDDEMSVIIPMSEQDLEDMPEYEDD